MPLQATAAGRTDRGDLPALRLLAFWAVATSADSSRTNELSLVENGMEVQVSLNGQNVLSLSNDRIGVGVGAVGVATVGAGSFEFQKFEIETSGRYSLEFLISTRSEEPRCWSLAAFLSCAEWLRVTKRQGLRVCKDALRSAFCGGHRAYASFNRILPHQLSD